MSDTAPSSVAAGQRLLPAERLRRREDFQRCYRQGRRRHGALATLYTARGAGDSARFGFTLSRKVGSAVTRNRVRRRLREIVRRWPQRRELMPLDVVVHVKPAAANMEFEELKVDLERLLSSLPRRRAVSPPPSSSP